MFVALAVMCAGIIVGRLFAGKISLKVVDRLLLAAIMLLLFVMGASIGDAGLLARLPRLGRLALLLTAFFIAGSIAAQVLLEKSGLAKPPPRRPPE